MVLENWWWYGGGGEGEGRASHLHILELGHRTDLGGGDFEK